MQLFSGLLALRFSCFLQTYRMAAFCSLSILLLVNSRVGAFLLLLSIAGIYFTSAEFLGGRDGSHDGVLDCAVINWEQIPECKLRAEQQYITGVDSKGVEHKFYVLFAFLNYPTEAYLLGLSTLQVLSLSSLRTALWRRSQLLLMDQTCDLFSMRACGSFYLTLFG